MAGLVGLMVCILGAVQPEVNRVQAVVAEFNNLRPPNNWEYARRLGAARDFTALTAISKSGSDYSPDAAFTAVRYLPSNQIVAFVRQFRPGSSVWVGAVTGIRFHPREAVIGYLRGAAKSPNSRVRAVCYEVCLERGWDDLLGQAKLDVSNTTGITVPNSEPETLGEIAQRYRAAFK